MRSIVRHLARNVLESQDAALSDIPVPRTSVRHPRPEFHRASRAGPLAWYWAPLPLSVAKKIPQHIQVKRVTRRAEGNPPPFCTRLQATKLFKERRPRVPLPLWSSHPVCEGRAPHLSSASMTHHPPVLAVRAQGGTEGNVVFTAVAPAARPLTTVHAGSSAQFMLLVVLYLIEVAGVRLATGRVSAVPGGSTRLLSFHGPGPLQERLDQVSVTFRSAPSNRFRALSCHPAPSSRPTFMWACFNASRSLRVSNCLSQSQAASQERGQV